MPDKRDTSHRAAVLLSVALLTGICGYSPLLAQSRTERLTTRIADYEQAIAGLDGSYTPASAEVFQAMAQARAELGDYEAAAANYREALQALRIHEGLASESQLEILDPFSDTLFKASQWRELDTTYHLAHDLTVRLYGADDPRSRTAAQRLASWKIRAFQTHVFRPHGDRSVQEAAEIYRVLLRDLPESPQSETRRAALLSAQGLAHFYAARHVTNIPVSEFQRLVPQTLSFQQCVPLVMSVDGAQPSASACHANQVADPEYFAAQQREKNNLVRRHLGNMRQSFMEAIEAVESDSTATLRERVNAILNLGDANLLAEDYQRARSQYARAWDMLTEAGAIALRQDLLDQPVKALSGILAELPFDRELQQPSLPGMVSFDVTERGEIVNIDVQGAPETMNRENIGAIAMRLDQSVYRPRLVDGRPVVARLTVAASEL